MTKKEREKILTAICKRIAKSDYGLLKENFEKEYNSRIDSDNRHSGDFTIEGRLMKRKIPKDYDEQKDWMKCVIKKLQDSSYVFDESDIENLNSFTSGINYLLKRTAASEAGMYDRVNLIKHGIACNDHLLDIAKLFNEIKTNTTWDSFKNMENGCYNFFFEKLKNAPFLYLFSHCKNCQNSDSFPLYYPQWQKYAQYFFSIPYNDYDKFCEHYNNLNGLGNHKLLNFSAYYYLLELKLKQDPEYLIITADKKEKEEFDKLIFVDKKENIVPANPN